MFQILLKKTYLIHLNSNQLSLPKHKNQTHRGLLGLLYSLMANVRPSPTMSMLRLTRVSRCSFLFSLSMATVSASPEDASTTFPPHSTCTGATDRTQSASGDATPPACEAWSRRGSYVVDGNDPAFPQQQEALLVVVVVVDLVRVDEGKVEGFGLAGGQEVVWKTGDGTKGHC